MDYLDYSLKTPEERIALVEKILASTPKEKQNSRFLSYLSDYILFVVDKGSTKGHGLLTRNRETTIKKREVSYEEVVSSLESGEDGLHALINNDKNQLLDHKKKISEEEIEKNPALKEMRESIRRLEEQFKHTTNNTLRFKLKQQIIETWQQIYIIEASGKATSGGHLPAQIKIMAHMPIEENIVIHEDGSLDIKSPVSLLSAEHISFLLNYYSSLKQETEDNLDSDMHWLLIDLDNLITKVLAQPQTGPIPHDILYDLIVWKIDGLTNEEIQEKMEIEHGIKHSAQYYSSLWRQRIPKMLSEQARKDWLIWHYENEEYGKWKQCTQCGEWKLLHPMFYARKASDKSGFRSECKECGAAKRHSKA